MLRLILRQLVDIYAHDQSVNLVLEYIEWDLEKIINDRSITYSPADTKRYMMALISAVEHCHQNWVLHRVCLIHSHLLPLSPLAHTRYRLTFQLPPFRISSRATFSLITKETLSYQILVWPRCMAVQVLDYLPKLVLGGIVHLSCCLVPIATVQARICGLLAAYLHSCCYVDLCSNPQLICHKLVPSSSTWAHPQMLIGR